MSSKLLPWFVVVLVVVSSLFVGIADPSGADSEASPTTGVEPSTAATPGATQTADNDSDGPRAGERLAGVVGVTGSAVGNDVSAGGFSGAVANASTADELAGVVHARLDRTARRIDDLERRRRALARARSNGTLSRGGYDARAADLAADLRAIRGLLDRAETATGRLSGDRRQRLRGRIADLRERTGSLLEGEVSAAARTIDGAGVEGAAEPIDLNDVVAAYERSGGSAPGPLVAVFGSERIVVHVERANGRTAVFGLRTEGGEVVEATRRRPENPTLRVDADYAAVRGVATAEEPWREASRALAEDRITYRGLGVVNTMKYGLIGAILFLFDGLRDLLFGAIDLLTGLIDLLVALVVSVGYVGY